LYGLWGIFREKVNETEYIAGHIIPGYTMRKISDLDIAIVHDISSVINEKGCFSIYSSYDTDMEGTHVEPTKLKIKKGYVI
jgi:hypothetical protein